MDTVCKECLEDTAIDIQEKMNYTNLKRITLKNELHGIEKGLCGLEDQFFPFIFISFYSRVLGMSSVFPFFTLLIISVPFFLICFYSRVLGMSSVFPFFNYITVHPQRVNN